MAPVAHRTLLEVKKSAYDEIVKEMGIGQETNLFGDETPTVVTKDGEEYYQIKKETTFASLEELKKALAESYQNVIVTEDSIFTVGMTAGISICHILRYGGSHHRLILLKLLPKGRLWRFFLYLRLLGLNGIFFCQIPFQPGSCHTALVPVR